MAGAVPEVMLRLRATRLARYRDALTVTGDALDTALDWWRGRRSAATALASACAISDGIDPDDVIMSPDQARAARPDQHSRLPGRQHRAAGLGHQSHRHRPRASSATDGVYRHRGPARVFTSERAGHPRRSRAWRASIQIRAGDVLVLAGVRPDAGTGMEETYQLTSALKFIPWGKQAPIVTDARFSGVSTGACIGHVRARGAGRRTPSASCATATLIEIEIDREHLERRGASGGRAGGRAVRRMRSGKRTA